MASVANQEIKNRLIICGIILIIVLLIVDIAKGKAHENSESSSSAVTGLVLPPVLSEEQRRINEEKRLAAIEAERVEAERRAEEARREGIKQQIRPLEYEEERIQKTILMRQDSIAALDGRRNKLRDELRDYRSQVQAFILDHKMAFACMGALGVTVDPKNEFSSDIKEVTGAVTILCALAAFGDDGFRKDVIDSVDVVTKASGYVDDLTSKINSTEEQLNATRAELVGLNQNLTEVHGKVEELQRQL